MSNYHKFNVGDIAISKYGKYPFKVTYVSFGDLSGKYLHNGGACRISQYNAIPYEPEEEPIMETKTLYSFTDDKDTTVFGTHIGTNSSNQYIIEIKGGGGIVIKDQKELEEVLPYTFSAIMNGKETHFQTEPGVVNKGDVLRYTGTQVPVVVSVKDIDTKSREARSKFNGVKLVTEKI